LRLMFLLRLGIFFGFMFVIYLSQRFWFVGAWHWIVAIQRSNLKNGLQILWFVTLLTVLAGFLDPMLGHALSKIAGGKWITAATRIWLIASFFGFLSVKLVGAIGWISAAGATLISPKHVAFDPARRNFFRYAAYLAGGLPFVAATYGFATGRLKYRVERVDIPIDGLPKALDGMKIVQLSDIHIGDFMPREEVRRAVQMANNLHADLAVVTGDFISSQYDPLEDCISELSKLRAPLGTWGCNGNHEIYADAEDSAQQLFERHGMKLLRQENVTVEHRGGKFNVIGVDYQRDHMTRGPRGPMLQGIEHLVSRKMPNILLSHNPNSFHRAAELGIELSLAGHTHGGQIKVEIVDHSITPARLITDFVAGLYHLPMANHDSSNGNGRKAFLYVNRGLGTFGMPVRIGVPPEITLLTLRAV
jgi:uncharacterized protein